VRLPCAHHYPFIACDFPFARNLPENPERDGVKPERASQQAGGEVRPVIVTREVRRFMEQNMMKFGWLQVRR